MRIFIIVPGGVDKSGQKNIIPALLWLIERLARQYEVVVIALSQYERPCRYKLHGAQVVNLGTAAGESKLSRLMRYRQLLNEIKVDYGSPDIIHAFWANNCGLLGGLAGKWWRVPAVLSIGGGELTWLPQIGYGGQGRRVMRARIAWALQLATIVTGGSRFVCDQISSREAVWLPLGVDTNQFSPGINSVPGPPWRLIQVATLNEVKDQTTLLQAFAQLRTVCPAVHLDLVGLDMLNGRLHHLAQKLALDNAVTFHGFLPQSDLLPLYRNAHLYAQSSLHESQGVAVLEAAACGLPTVGTAVGLVAEMAPMAATAVSPGDSYTFAAALLHHLQTPQSLGTVGQAAREWAQTYNADWTAKQFAAIYQEALAR